MHRITFHRVRRDEISKQQTLWIPGGPRGVTQRGAAPLVQLGPRKLAQRGIARFDELVKVHGVRQRRCPSSGRFVVAANDDAVQFKERLLQSVLFEERQQRRVHKEHSVRGVADDIR